MTMEIKVGGELPQKKDLNKIHQKWNFWELSAKVNSDYLEGKDDKGSKIIKPFSACEKKEDYADRVKRTNVRNLIAPALNQYRGVIFRNDPERDERISDIIENADGRGSSLNKIMQKSASHSLVYGIGPLLLENSVGGVLSLAQAREVGETQRIIAVDPYAMINWNIVDDYLIECIINFVDSEGKPFARYYNDTIVQDIILDEKGKKVVGIGEEIEHGYSSIPVSLTQFEFDNESFVEPLAQIQMSINNLLSLVSEELYQHAFSRFILSGVEGFQNMTKEEQESLIMNVSSRRLMILPSEAKLDRLGSDIQQADNIRKSIEQDQEQFQKTAGMVSDQVGMQASAEARELARENFNVVATTIIEGIENSENYILSLYGESLGIDIQKSYYSRSFEAPRFQEEINQLRDILALNFGERDLDIKSRAIDEFDKKFFTS